MERTGVTWVVDVGASAGQYALDLRREGYRGRILSVEPLADSYAMLAQRCARDHRWDCLNMAMGRRSGQCRINVAANLTSSSLLPMGALHEAAEPRSAYRASKTVEMRRLDDVAQAYGLPNEDVAIKLDVQGYELEVLAGGEKTVESAVLIECEVTFVELYKSQPLATDVVAFMAEHGLRPAGVRQGFTDPATDEALQADVLFVRTRTLAN